MLHSFWYVAAVNEFENVRRSDSGCTMADWGIATANMLNALAGQGAGPVQQAAASDAIERARTAGPRTEREGDYLDAVSAYYQDAANRPEKERQRSRAAAYEALSAKYPDDDEAQIIFALYLAATQEASDKTFSVYKRSAEILEPLLTQHPDHPGIVHYLIHVYDAPPLAADGLVAARAYARIAPDSPHALHMPSHIFTRVGAWPESADTNTKAMQSAAKDADANEEMHATDYRVYADLQMAKDAEAKAIIDNAPATGFDPARHTAPYAKAAIAARYNLERDDWAAAAALVPNDSKFLYTQALTHFARALGAARSGNPDVADIEVQKLGELQAARLEEGNKYWATEVEVSLLTATAWTQFARDQRDEALVTMRRAADLEDSDEKHIVTPGRLLPARELLADMLLQGEDPGAAFVEYETSLLREPNRFRSLAGAAQSARGAGKLDEARLFLSSSP
jgi:hypothetical protein